MSGYLFVTAPEADYKAVNLLLHELSNWGYNDGGSDFKLITAKNADFSLDVLHSEDSGADGPSLFMVVDTAGFEGRNAIVVERAIDEEDENFKSLDSFVKMRIPWNEVNSAWCNLSIANISFDELGELREDDADEGGEGERVDGESGANGWHDYESMGGGLNEKNAKKKVKALQSLKMDGRV
ncbi:hypothetical protein Q7P35_009800 [Cladosporium inversicolor]